VTPCLFSQSLFALPLYEAIEATAKAGYCAIELACTAPHLDLDTARHNLPDVVRRIEDAGIETAALSLFNHLTMPEVAAKHVADACAFIERAPEFGVSLIKMTPGPPASADASADHWRLLEKSLDQILPVAKDAGVRLAFETHMRQLTDTVASAKRLLDMTPPDTIGLTVDFCNLAFAGETMDTVFDALGARLIHAHVKNGYIAEDGSWHFGPLDQGLTDYSTVIDRLLDLDYNGWLSVECLGPDAATQPLDTAIRDRLILQRFLERDFS